MAELLAFVGVAVAVIVTPGQDTALTVRNTLANGRRAGIRTAMGVVCGQSVWVLAASVGVATLLVASEPAFLALKFAGAAYLVYLGAQALLAAARRRPAGHAARAPKGGELRQGLLSAYAVAIARAGDVLRRPRVRRTMDAVTGTALVALGARLATTDR